MPRGKIYHENYKPQLSGHETFPLRYGWLKKVFDAVYSSEDGSDNKSIFIGDDAIARFGVGKNMVASMRHWANAVGIIADGETPGAIITTNIGRKLFGPHGLDPYLEHPASLWLIHWQLSGHTEKTTWFWAFNHYPGLTFERDGLVRGLEKVAKERSWSRAAASTIRRDVECFVRTYVAKNVGAQSSPEDALESPLAELGLIKAVGKNDGFRFVRGPKSTLGDGVFLYSLIDFWSDYSPAKTLSFEAIAHEPGSPGRVFLLDENDIAERLLDLEDSTDGAFRWSETAGLKQVLRDVDLNLGIALDYIDADFHPASKREAA